MQTEETPQEDVWTDLVVSALAVNSFPLNKAYDLVPSLRDQQLLDGRVLATLPEDAIARCLYEAGYRRGAFMAGLMSKRLSQLGRRLSDPSCIQTLSRGDTQSIAALLRPVPGIGPFVIQTFLELRGLTSSQSIPRI